MIESQSNFKIKQVSRLLNKKRDRYDSHAFVCEGRRIVSDIPRKAIKELYISESRADEVSALFLEDNIPTEIVSDALMRKLSDTITPQGLLAVVRMPEWTIREVLSGRAADGGAKRQPLLIVLEDVSDPGNLGTIFRVAEAAGVTGIILTKGTTDVFAPKVVRSTMGSIFRMPFFIADDLEAAISDIKSAGIGVFAATLDGQDLYRTGDFRAPTAFVLGNEAHGVSAGTIALCDGCVTIPMESDDLESLNVAMAAGILSYEALRQRRTA